MSPITINGNISINLRKKLFHFGKRSRFLLYGPLTLGLIATPMLQPTQVSMTHISTSLPTHLYDSEKKLPWVVSHSQNIYKVPTSYYKPTFLNQEITQSNILEDPEQRISQDFKIPNKFKRRVSFWFDIYTKYGSQDHVIHHSQYPWIVFRVINTQKIMDGKGHYWTRYHRAKNTVSRKASQIRKTLKRLAKRKSYRNLKGLEKRLYNKLRWVRGKRRHVFAFAARKVRSQLGQMDFFLKGLMSSTKYMIYIEEEFKKQGLPQELTRLPFVESSFNEAARSKVGASGIWQIMPTTAKGYIQVTRHIDERNSPLKSSRVAAKVLKQYKKSLKYWPVTITAYNHGIGGMKRAIRKAKTSRLDKIIYRYKSKSLGFASKNFYTSFLAALYAEKYHYEIFKDKELIKEPLIKREIIYLSKKMRANKLLKRLGLSQKELLSYNLDLKNALKHNAYLPKNLEVHIPLGHNQKLIKNIHIGRR